MPFISNSQDIFFLVLAFCVLWITVLLAWLLYYVISMVRDVHRTIARVKQTLQAVEDTMSMLKEKFNGSASYITGLATTLAKVVGTVVSSKNSGRKSKS